MVQVARTDLLVSNCEKSCCATHHFKYKKREFFFRIHTAHSTLYTITTLLYTQLLHFSTLYTSTLLAKVISFSYPFLKYILNSEVYNHFFVPSKLIKFSYYLLLFVELWGAAPTSWGSIFRYKLFVCYIINYIKI